jgi:hypothetical protein
MKILFDNGLEAKKAINAFAIATTPYPQNILIYYTTNMSISLTRFTNAWDAKQINAQNSHDWQTSDVIFHKPTGEVFSADKAIHAALEMYAPFSAHKHEPSGPICCWETANGWEMLGQATLFADLPVPGGAKVHKDLSGKEWDLAMPGMFHFEYVKDKEAKYDGIRMKAQRTFSDSAPAMVEMIKRGMVKPEQLLG